MTRRLLCDMFEVPIFKDMIKAKVEMKLKEIAVSIIHRNDLTFYICIYKTGIYS